MIALTRLNHAAVVLNSDLIETIEVTPDTVIRLTNGQRIIVLEGTAEILEKVREFRRSVSGRWREAIPPVGSSVSIGPRMCAT